MFFNLKKNNKMKFFVLIVLTVFSINLVEGHTNLGFDTSVAFLDQDFYDCVAGRLNWNQKGFAIVPYDANGDFTDEITRAKKAGFREVHLLLDPDTFPFVNVHYLPDQILKALQAKGTFVAGFWIKVTQGSRFWRSEGFNLRRIESLLNAFEATFLDYGETNLGVYTTNSDWNTIVGSSFSETRFEGAVKLKYWAAINESPTTCDVQDPTKSICYFQQIQYHNTACGAPFNVNIKRIDAVDRKIIDDVVMTL